MRLKAFAAVGLKGYQNERGGCNLPQNFLRSPVRALGLSASDGPDRSEFDRAARGDGLSDSHVPAFANAGVSYQTETGMQISGYRDLLSAREVECPPRTMCRLS